MNRVRRWLRSFILGLIQPEINETITQQVNAIQLSFNKFRYEWYAKEHVEDNTIAAIGAIYTLFNTEYAGFIGGLVSLSGLSPGDAVEISAYARVPDREGGFREERFINKKIANPQADPLIQIPEYYAPFGGSIKFSQTEGLAKKFFFSMYRR